MADNQNVRYIARRSLSVLHTAGTQYSQDLPLRDKDRGRKVERDQQKSLDGHLYTTYYNGAVVWHCKTRPLTGLETSRMREFLDSVEDGQVFDFDPTYGAGHSPSDYRSVTLDGTGYTEQRTMSGTSQSSHRFTFTFDLRETP